MIYYRYANFAILLLFLLELLLSLIEIVYCNKATKNTTWDCLASSNSGTFYRNSDCIINGSEHVVVNGLLEIIGTANGTAALFVPTIKASVGNRHFFVNHSGKLTIRSLKLVGGDVTCGSNRRGGSIYNIGSLHIFSSIVSSNQAHQSGGIYAEGYMYLFDTHITNNKADDNFGGMHVHNSPNVVIIRKSNISNNKALAYGGIGIQSSRITIVNTTISKNQATFLAAGIYVYGQDIEKQIELQSSIEGISFQNLLSASFLNITNCEISNNFLFSQHNIESMLGGGGQLF